MSEERKKVLELLAAGKITSDEANRLLEKLESPRESESSGQGDASPSRPVAPKYLRVLVDGTNGDTVNVRIPLVLVKTGIKLSTMLPSNATARMKEKGIDLGHLSELQGDELLEALQEFTVNVDSSDGDTVRVFCE